MNKIWQVLSVSVVKVVVHFLNYSSTGHAEAENVHYEVTKVLDTDGLSMEKVIILFIDGANGYGHVLQKEDNDWMKKCMEYEV